ncbi:hypothetical protein DTO271G3_5411 [Paecilomyces variotii]|nr:hypothetical protein DTO271G3_5411 [Paecilomyces variotii]
MREKVRQENKRAAKRMGTTTSSRNSKSAGKRKRRAQPNIREVTPGLEDTDTDRDSGDISPSGRRSPMRGSAKKQRERPIMTAEDRTHTQSAGDANPLEILIPPSGISLQNPVYDFTLNKPEAHAADIEVLDLSAMDTRDSSVAHVSRLPSAEQMSLPRDPMERQPQERLRTASMDRDDVNKSFSSNTQPREQSHNATNPTTGSDWSMTPQQISEFDMDDSQRDDLTNTNMELDQQPMANTPSSKNSFEVSQKHAESTSNGMKALDTIRQALDEGRKATDSLKTIKKEKERLQAENKSLVEELDTARNEIERYQAQAAKCGERLEQKEIEVKSLAEEREISRNRIARLEEQIEQMLREQSEQIRKWSVLQ